MSCHIPNKVFKRDVKQHAPLNLAFKMSAYLVLASMHEDKAVLPGLKKRSGR